MKACENLTFLKNITAYINMLDEQEVISLDEARELEEALDIIHTFLIDRTAAEEERSWGKKEKK